MGGVQRCHVPETWQKGCQHCVAKSRGGQISQGCSLARVGARAWLAPARMRTSSGCCVAHTPLCIDRLLLNRAHGQCAYSCKAAPSYDVLYWCCTGNKCAPTNVVSAGADDDDWAAIHVWMCMQEALAGCVFGHHICLGQLCNSVCTQQCCQ